jgi:hypothetical protein
MQSSTASSSLKRKLSYPELPVQQPPAVLKKPKMATDAATPAVATNSYIYCHQCGKKRDKEGSLVLRVLLHL